MKKLITAALIATAGLAQAGEVSLVLHGLSYHTNARQSGLPWNNTNYGLALRYAPNSDWSYQAGGYRDSVFKPTLYALGDYTPLHIGQIALGGFVGAKQSTSTPLRPIGGLVARYQAGGWGVATRLAPAPQSKGAVLTLEVSRDF